MSALTAAYQLLAEHDALLSRVRTTQRAYRRSLRTLPSPPYAVLRLPVIPSPSPSPPPSRPTSPSLSQAKPPPPPRNDLPPAKRARVARYKNYVPEEETIRNDYSQHYVDSGEWPQNWILGAEPERRFEEYPKQQRLLALKKTAVAETALPPCHLPLSDLTTLLPNKFDVILIDPPFSDTFTWDNLGEMNISSYAADPSFVFLWVGSGAGDGLEQGRAMLAKWGYRRCEDVVWVKTNKENNKGPGTDPPTTSLFTRTKQHCLMGIRGTVRRSTDSWFVHCNIDTDVIVWEGSPSDPTMKPPEMYQLIENFCLGLRRLELFGRTTSLRRGWVTVTNKELTSDDVLEYPGAVRWDKESWETSMKEFTTAAGGKYVVANTQEIETLRPKSPVRGGSSNNPNNRQGGGHVGGPGGPPPSTGPGNMNLGSMNMGMPVGMMPPQNMGFDPQMATMMGMGGMPGVGMDVNAMNMGMGWGGMGGMIGSMPGMGTPGNMGGMPNMPMGNMGGMTNMDMSAMMGMNQMDGGGAFGGQDQFGGGGMWDGSGAGGEAMMPPGMMQGNRMQMPWNVGPQNNFQGFRR